MNIIIREVQEEDLEKCAKAFSGAYSGEPWNHKWDIDRAIQYLSEYYNSSKFIGYIVCDEYNQVLAGLFAHERTWFNSSEIYIDEVFVSPEAQGQGLATKLLNKVKEIVKTRRLLGISLMTHRGFPAEQVYKKHGFTKEPELMYMEFDPKNGSN